MLESFDTEDNDDDDDSKSEHSEDELDSEYECTKMAAQLLLSLILQCRKVMKQKLTTIQDDAERLPFLNMRAIYTKGMDADNEYVDVVMGELEGIMNSVLNGKQSEKFQFLRSGHVDIMNKLYRFIARCCELMVSILSPRQTGSAITGGNDHNDDEEWDIYPTEMTVGNTEYDDSLHVKDELSGNGSTVVDYCVFPGIEVIGLVKGTNGQVKQRMWVCLSYLQMHLPNDPLQTRTRRMTQLNLLKWKATKLDSKLERAQSKASLNIHPPKASVQPF